MATEIVIGVDVGMHKGTGLALYLPGQKRFIDLISMDLIDAYNLCMEYHNNPDYKVVIVVENANLDSNVFGGDQVLVKEVLNWVQNLIKNSTIPTILGLIGLFFSQKKPKGGIADSVKELQKKIRALTGQSRNVGKNQGLAVLLVEKLKKGGCNVAEVAPSERQQFGNKIKIGKHEVYLKPAQLTMPTKVPSEEFKEWTKCEISTNDNEHVRDAACLVYGNTWFYWSNFARTRDIKKKKPKPKK